MANVSADVMAVLTNCLVINTVDFEVAIDREISREVYVGVNAVFDCIGGRWNRSKRVHVFPYNPEPVIQQVLETGVMPPKNPTAFYPTPLSAIEDMFGFVDSMIFYQAEHRTIRVLEPSAGSGFIAEYIRDRIAPGTVLETVELLEANQRILKAKGFNPFCGSFLDYAPEEGFDYILMNPPFSVAGDSRAYITHIEHAFNMLRPNGQLVAIAPYGWMTNKSKKDVAFRELVATYMDAEVGHLPAGTFKDSGTNVATCIISLKKDGCKLQEYCGHKNYFVWDFVLRFENNNPEIYEKFSEMVNDGRFDFDEVRALCERFIQEENKTAFAPLPLSQMDHYVERLRSVWEYDNPGHLAVNYDPAGQGCMF